MEIFCFVYIVLSLIGNLPCSEELSITATADDILTIYDDGTVVFQSNDWKIANTINLTIPYVLTVRGYNKGGAKGILASTSTGIITDETWKCNAEEEDNWHSYLFDDSHWSSARVYALNGESPWAGILQAIDPAAKWIWGDNVHNTIFCRKRLLPHKDICFMRKQGFNYMGRQNVTKSGIACDRWDIHGFSNPKYFPDKTVSDAQNFCRNPSRPSVIDTEKPWCHIAESNGWEYCRIDRCPPFTTEGIWETEVWIEAMDYLSFNIHLSSGLPRLLTGCTIRSLYPDAYYISSLEIRVLFTHLCAYTCRLEYTVCMYDTGLCQRNDITSYTKNDTIQDFLNEIGTTKRIQWQRFYIDWSLVGNQELETLGDIAISFELDSSLSVKCGDWNFISEGLQISTGNSKDKASTSKEKETTSSKEAVVGVTVGVAMLVINILTVVVVIIVMRKARSTKDKNDAPNTVYNNEGYEEAVVRDDPSVYEIPEISSQSDRSNRSVQIEQK